jgi:hypothetical protein
MVIFDGAAADADAPDDVSLGIFQRDSTGEAIQPGPATLVALVLSASTLP